MNDYVQSGESPDARFDERMLETLIRAGIILALVLLCFQIFAPFLTLMVWAVILAVALYPTHQAFARRVGGRQGLAATLLVLVATVLIVGPTALLLNSLGDSVHGLVDSVQNDTLAIPAPSESVAQWPVIGERVYAAWTLAHTNLPLFVQSLQPKVGDVAKAAVGMVASIGTGLMLFVAAFIIAGIVMTFGEGGARTCEAIFKRFAGEERGDEYTRLSTATIRAVAKGVIGVAFIQAIVVGLCLLIAGVPWAGALAVVVLVLGVAQIPAVIVTLPAIAWIWWSGSYGTVEAVMYTVMLFLAGMADNVLKPLMLGRGVDAPMPVILLGALGGMAAAGILGMFVGATLLALGYQLFMEWVATRPDAKKPPVGHQTRQAA